MTLEYLVLFVFALALLLLGFWFGRYSAQLDERKVDSGAKIKPRFLPSWLWFHPSYEWRANYWQGLSTEMIGGLVTAVLLGLVITFVQRMENERSQKEQLILQMGSPDNAFAIEAVRQLGALGWLYDGSLHGAFLLEANLQRAYLGFAELQGANLKRANLQRANFYQAELENANLSETNLQRAFLFETILQEANLVLADLQGANLMKANLRGANLWNARFDVSTVLPNGNHWTPETDWTQWGAVLVEPTPTPPL